VHEADFEAPFAIWRERRASGDATASLGDLYKLVAQARGKPVEQLTSEERAQIWALAAPIMEPGFEIIPDSERNEADPIELVQYDPEWPLRFEAKRQRLSKVLRPRPIRIDHVGSTAIPGLAAKPVVDIQISVEDIRNESAYVPSIESIGVQFRSRDNEHRYFRRPPASYAMSMSMSATQARNGREGTFCSGTICGTVKKPRGST
jgi:hypothetical protein